MAHVIPHDRAHDTGTHHQTRDGIQKNEFRGTFRSEVLRHLRRRATNALEQKTGEVLQKMQRCQLFRGYCTKQQDA